VTSDELDVACDSTRHVERSNYLCPDGHSIDERFRRV